MQKTAASKSLSKREFGVVESNKLRTPQTTSKYVLFFIIIKFYILSEGLAN